MRSSLCDRPPLRPSLEQALQPLAKLLRGTAQQSCAFLSEPNDAATHALYADAELLGQSRRHGGSEGLLELKARVVQIALDAERQLDLSVAALQQVHDALSRHAHKRAPDSGTGAKLEV